MRLEDIRALTDRVARQGRRHLLESEGFELLQLMGIAVPRFVMVSDPLQIGEQLLAGLPGDQVVLKVSAADLLHKSDVGGVQVVSKTPADVAAVAAKMARSMVGRGPQGLLIQEFVPYSTQPGNEALLSARWDREFGPVVTFGIGGAHAERITTALRETEALAIFQPGGAGRRMVEQELSGLLVTDLMTRSQRGQPPRLARQRLVGVVQRFAETTSALLGDLLEEIEINPLVVKGESLLALDVLAKLPLERPRSAPSRPLEKLDRLLRPRSVAIVGVGNRLNPGRRILGNLLREGFDPAKVWVVKPGREKIDGCRCYQDIASLPHAVDLLIVSVGAQQVPDVIDEAIAHRRAESVILISGGLEEKQGSRHLSDRVRRSVVAARDSHWHGPLVNGGNCLGIRSQPGGYDTFFLPPSKMNPIRNSEGNVALLAQSGAFLASKMSKLPWLRIRYAISIGNQIDLTLGDYLTYLADEQEVDLFGVYVEGFRDLDGRAFLEAARRITAAGRRMVLYRAGRSRTGAAAAASHTAALAGSWRTTRALAREAGVQVVDALEDFEDLMMLSSAFVDRDVGCSRIGAVSNAGYECVALWDGLRSLEPATFSDSTRRELAEIFASSRIDAVVDVRNPLDVTPMVGDAQFEAAVRLVLQDAAVGVGVVGCVPFTGTLNTLPGSPSHGENVEDPTSIACRLVQVWQQTSKPWVAVVDAGIDYDTLAKILLEGGLPVFRTADRAVRTLERYFEKAPASG